MRIQSFGKFIWSVCFDYYTARLIKVRDTRTIICYRLFQLIIIGYIVGWSIVYKKGYQETDTVSSTITSKVKGLGFTNNSLVPRTFDGKLIHNTGSKLRIFDTADYVVPPTQYSSTFVMTNFDEITQTQGLCDEDFYKVNCNCTSDADCTEKAVTTNTWNGIPTGKCINSSIDPNVTVCQIASWCPVEREEKDGTKNLIQNIENFTIFIKNDIQFKLFNKKERNVLSNITNDYISNCPYEKVRSINCPTFLLSEILDEAEPDLSERKMMLAKGGVIQIEINWKCNYDIFWNPCTLKYKFNRFDLRFSESSGASGFNFRFSDRYEEDNEVRRMLVKAYGLRFIIDVTGNAGKFNVVPLLITIGSGLGLLTLATIAADLVLSFFAKNKEKYQRLKILDTRTAEKLLDEHEEEI